MQHPVDALLADPWGTLRFVVGDPLHPGGAEATADLLDRAGVTRGTRVLDVGCGAGGALSLARGRGATALGLDRTPRGEGTVRGDLTHFPIRDGSVDVVLAECVLCLSPDLSVSLSEARRVLDVGGRLALSDVVVDGDLPSLPPALARALCLTGPREHDGLLDRIERAGFRVTDVQDHREDLLAMRDRASSRVDYEGLLGALGDRGRRLLVGIRDLEDAIETGRVGYVSLVAEVDA